MVLAFEMSVLRDLGKSAALVDFLVERVTHTETEIDDSEAQVVVQEAVANAEKAVAKTGRSKTMRDRNAILLRLSPALPPEVTIPVDLSKSARACAASTDQSGTGAGLVPPTATIEDSSDE